MTPIRLFAAGIAGVSLAGCAGLFQDERRPVAQAPRTEPAPVVQTRPVAQQPQVRAEPLRQQAQAQPQFPPRAASQELVRNVQKELQSAGINPGPIDGIWGPRTAQALRQYQRQNDLETTAQLNAPTLASLGIADQEAQTAMGEQGAAAGGTQPQGQQQGAKQQQGQQQQGIFAKADEDDNARLSREEYRDAMRMRQGQQAAAGDQKAGGQAGAGGQAAAGGATAQADFGKDVIMQVQKTLNDKGFDAGPVDGSIGETTRRALQNFQQAQGMEASGELNQKTLAALGIKQGAQ